ncbi:FKBP-type peptidyl-prolyl cis-trans isomerase [Pseudoduganella sp. OTU4001]|uniref:FKBP-type peptidyl-prolyl cis-trans isomerase n=1 Tax=Pseudoduganella sp. OTU4001 TaxID=3043854 RepID=UPI00313B1A20
MKNTMFKVIASLACALALVACGGGGDDKPTTTTPEQPAFTKVDTVVGSNSVEVSNGDLVTVHYTGWLYDAAATDKKGKQFETSRNGNPFAFTVGRGQVIVGWDQGLLGMKVGGKRTLIIPANMAYGASGNSVIPANTALVFDVEVMAISR